MENNHNTPIIIVAICGISDNREINTHTLERKKAVGKKAEIKLRTEIFDFMNVTPMIPRHKNMLIVPNKSKNRFMIHMKTDFPYNDTMSNIISVLV